MLDKILAFIANTLTPERMTLTRTNNAYVNTTNFNRLVCYKTGKTGVLFLNLAMSTSMPNGTALTQIGTISGVTLKVPHDITIPCQSNNATILVEITAAGAIMVGNYSGTATGTNFFRGIVPLVFA